MSQTERIPIQDLRPGDQFRLLAILPTLTIERIGPTEKPEIYGIVTREDDRPIRESRQRLVHLVKRASISLLLLASLCAIPSRAPAQSPATREKPAVIAACQQGQLDAAYLRLALSDHSQSGMERRATGARNVQADVTRTNGFHSIASSEWVRMLNMDWRAFHDAQEDAFRSAALAHMSDDWRRIEAYERGRK